MKSFIGIHKSNDVYLNSSSGGAFTAITDYFFDNYKNLSIYGCVIDDKLNVYHKECKTKKERDELRGSKYIQSNLNSIYSDIKENLNNSKVVLFCGSPCQVVALKNYLSIFKVNMDNLWTIDFICHGVGSPYYFDKYIEYLEKKYKSKAVLCKFRGKSKPGKLQDMYIKFENGKKYSASTTKLDLFYSVYLKNLILRDSCYDCKYSSITRHSDFTLADDWSVKRVKDKGRSQIIFNSEKSMKLISYLKKNMIIEECNINDLNQPNLKKTTEKPMNCEEFWKILNNEGFTTAQKFIGNCTLKYRLKLYVANFLDYTNLRNIIKK